MSLGTYSSDLWKMEQLEVKYFFKYKEEDVLGNTFGEML
jgi:hypothetical protein